MNTALLPVPRIQFSDANGVPLAGVGILARDGPRARSGRDGWQHALFARRERGGERSFVLELVLERLGGSCGYVELDADHWYGNDADEYAGA